MAGPTIKLTFAGDTTDLDKAMGHVGDSADKMTKSFSLKSAGLAVAGSAAAAGLSSAFMGSLDVQAGQQKLNAQVGAYGKDAEALGKTTGAIFAAGYGESMEDVSEATKAALQNLPGLTASSPELAGYTKQLMDLSTVMGEDVGDAATAVGQMVKTGMVPDVKAGVDILTVLSQNGLGELTDLFTEYSTQFRKVGIDASMAGGLIKQAMDAGAPSTDVAADALKEFAIRAADATNPTTVQGFGTLGLSADDMAKKFAAGGSTAQGALEETFTKLRALKDPVEQNTVATDLFGTQWEDMGAALLAMDPSSAVQGLGDVKDAAAKSGEALHDTAANKITEAQRGFQNLVDSVVGVQGPLGDVVAGIMGVGGQIVPLLGSLGMAAMALQSMGAFTGIATAAQWLWNAALNANPIGLVVLAIAALVAGVIWAYNNVAWFRDGVNAAFGAVKSFIGGAVDWISSKWQGLMSWFSGLPGRIGGIFSSIGSGISGAFRSALNFVSDIWNNTIGRLSWSVPSWVPVIGGNTISVPKLPHFHTGGVVPGAQGQEMLAVLQAGERVIPTDRAGNGGGPTTLTLSGNVDSAMGTAIQKLIRTGDLVLS